MFYTRGVADLGALQAVVPDSKRGLLSLVRPASELETGLVQVSDDLARALPRGGLPKGQTVSVTGNGSTWFCLRLISRLTEQGGWAAFVGDTKLSAPAMLEAGVALDRVAVVRDPGEHFTTVVDALVAALDVVIVSGARLRPAQARGLAARVKERGSVLVTRDIEWPVSSDLELRLKSSWSGLGSGFGRLDRRDLSITASGRRVPTPVESRLAV